jgi:aldehyde dehydrogenase (NAD+)
LSFTGSVEVGKLVSKAAAEHVTPVTLELGGKSPNVVFADADIDAAMPVLVNSIIQNAGQTCSAGSRLLVEASAHDRVVGELVDRFQQVSLGPGPSDPDMGPLISATQLDRVSSYVELGKTEARAVTGGGQPHDDSLKGGYFFMPTVFDDVPPTAVIAQEEIFGPVLTVIRARDEDHAVALANDSIYGLNASVFTADTDRAYSVARRLRSGTVGHNAFRTDFSIAFGGYKQSGIGREGGREGLLPYLETKTVILDFTR